MNANTPRAGNGKTEARAVPTVPFIRASGEHVEPTGIDVTRTLTASAQQLGNFDIPAIGYARALFILVEATGGDAVSTTTTTVTEDSPWNVLQDVAFTEPNGAVIAQFNNGHELYLANKWGGLRPPPWSDPKNWPTYSAPEVGTDGGGNFTFALRIPIELSQRDGLGALPNQNAAASFKLRLSLAPSSTVYGTAPDTALPSVRVRVFLEAWDQPEASMAGAMNQVTPPAMNTTQFWSTQVYNVAQGRNTIRLHRVGQYIRNLIFVLRDTATPDRASGETNWPDTVQLFLDTRPVLSLQKSHWQQLMYERSGIGGSGVSPELANGKDNGVYVVDMTHEFSGVLGHENRDLWLPTLASTRLEVQGDVLNAGGTLTVLTNDVSIAGPVFV